MQKGNANVFIEKCRLKQRKHELEELMQMFMARYDLLSKKEYYEKMEELKGKCKEIDAAIASSEDSDTILDGKTALSAEELIGVEKRRAMTLAEQAFAKSKEDLVREQKEAEEFVRKLNGERAELDKRKAEYKRKIDLKQKLEEQKKKEEEDTKKIEDEEKRKKKLESLLSNRVRQEEERKKEREESKAKIDKVLNSKPLYKQKEEII